ncbi:MAG TPA: putative 2-aminoethylphosphonate ABC transporter substrate-binding protein [Dongiaceae bacterium]|nr:putative 2-aminoethylphosphonate ABC transporter substrate-binding protein [Dongiaceae bacterium]
MSFSLLQRLGVACLGATLGLTVSVLSAQADTVLKVYTALEEEQLPVYKAAFEKANPGITIEWQRDSTGVITARLLAEKENRQADAVWGLAATSLMLLDKQGMLDGYKPAGFEQIKDSFKDTRGDKPTWVGMDAWASAICYNTVEGQKAGVPKPESWADLLKPEYKGHVVMPNPGSSGTGFLDVAGWLQIMGDKGGWDYMDKLHQNISTYLHSGSKPCKAAAAGEYVVGISFAYPGVMQKNQGAPIEIILPKDGIGWDMEATGIMKGTKNLEAAQKLADFAASADANKMYNDSYQVLARRDVDAKVPENYPANEQSLMIKNDFYWAAAHRQEILDEWTKRYNDKDAKQ